MKAKILLSSLLISHCLLSGVVHAEEKPIRYYQDSKLSQVLVEDETTVEDIFNQLPLTLPIQSNVDDYQFFSAEVDDRENMHYAMVPVIDEIPVFEYMLLIHTDSDGYIRSISGELDRPALEVSNRKVISSELATQFALSELGYPAELPNYQPDAKVTISANYALDIEKMKLVYYVFIDDVETTASTRVTIDAENGSILDKKEMKPGIREKHFTARGKGVFDENYVLPATKINQKVYLTGDVYGTPLTTFVMNKSSLGYQVAEDNDGIFDDDKQKVVVQAHYNMQQVLRFFYEHFNWRSFDGEGAPVEVVVNYTEDGEDLDNAMWDGTRFVFGAGEENLSYNNAIANDIVGHEFMHAVTQFGAGLVYEHQSGALDESLSDMFGYFIDSEDSTIGEDILQEGGDPNLVLRSLEDPTLYGQPGHMRDYVKAENNLDGDYGGVHINNGIPNKAGYLTAKAIGIEKTMQIYFNAVQHYLVPFAEFSDARIAFKLSAEDLFGSQSDEVKAIEKAWDEVGVGE
ncbi:peptidase M4 family protein [Aerococcaceae bacterium zg-ZJ1578]|uniref:M4 family metallopeptidase n=1 Tax=Aerococcaceae bacterium zg-252 TaxID=2796928 RepID=UPI001A304168|nr:peptidase M4 family protein [Aerococcaceae bacterium zg-1578]